MAFLTINGITIPVASKQASESRFETGQGFRRAFDGSGTYERRTTKRVWKLKTQPLTEIQALEYEGIIRGTGHQWNFEYTSATASTPTFNLYSTTGLGYGSTIGSVQPVTGSVAGNAIINVNGVTQSAPGSGTAGLLSLGPATTNKLADNVANGSEAGTVAEWTNVAGGTVSSSTTRAVLGSRSVKIAVTASGDGAWGSITGLSTSTTYYPSAYVLHDSGSNATVQMRLVKNDAGTGATSTVSSGSVAGSQWRRLYDSSGFATGTSTAYRFEFTSLTAASFNIYVDCGMVTTARMGNSQDPPPWTTGTRTAGSLAYSALPWAKAYDITIAFWAKADYVGSSVTDYLLEMAGQSNFYVGRSTSAATLSIICPETNGTATSMGTLTTGWNHYAVTIRKNKETEESYNLITFKNGAAVSSGTTTGYGGAAHDPTYWTSVYLGNLSGGSYFEGAISKVRILPFAMSSADITALYNFENTGSNNLVTPYYIGGDIITESDYLVKAYGMVTGVSRMGAKDPGAGDTTWHSNKYVIEFELQEA